MAELNALMPFKAPPDLSKFCVADAGPAGRGGRGAGAGGDGRWKLAVIEAMKMEHILLATQDGVVAEVSAAKGESLSVDQIIITFA